MNIQPPAHGRSRRHLWLILAGILLVLAAIGALTGNYNTSTATNDQPTATIVPATHQPTLQTLKTLTTAQRAIQIAQHAAPNASKQTANVDSPSNLTITEIQDIKHITSVKVNCFNMLQALLPTKLSSIYAVDLEVHATLIDANGNQVTANVGECSLSHNLNWSTLDFRSAWNNYDTMFVAPNLPT